MQEFNRKEDAKQCLELAKVFKERAAKLKKEPCRQPSKKKKRTEADKLKRAEAFAKIKADKYIPVGVASRLDEAATARQEYQSSATAPAPARPTAPAWTPPQTYKPVHEASGYDAYWARQEAAQRAQEASGNARIVQQPDQPQAAPLPAPQRPPQKDDPGYVIWLLREVDRRKRAGTWTGK